MKATFCVVIFVLIAPWLRAQTNLTDLLQQGMFEEQANHNLDAAISNYQALSTQFDKDRQLAATAIFRLGECYREEGQTNEAAIEYRRILNEFPDQKSLATLSQEDLAGIGAAAPVAAAGSLSTGINNSSPNNWDKVKNLPEPELEKVLPTLVPDSVLTSLLQQRNTAETTLAQKRTNLGKFNPEVTAQEAVLATINQQIANRVIGIMDALKIQYEVTQRFATGGSGGSANDEDQEIARIQDMIQNSPDLINAPDEHGHTPLEKAAMDGSLKVAAYLLDHGADVNAGKYSALNMAANAGNRAMVTFLLDHGADINAKAWAGETPLHTAVSEGYKAVTEALLAHKADLDARDDSGATPLLKAAQNGHGQIVQTLLNAGANPNIPDKDGRTPLSYAAASGSPETIKTLLAAKADPNTGTLDAPLLCAIDKQDLASAELLLQAGADPNVDGLMHCAQGSYGSKWDGAYSAIIRKAPALWLAIQNDQLPMVQLLLKYKANPDNSEISEPPAVIFWALDKTNILQALLNAGANPNLTRGDGRTPLSIAAETGMLESVKLLLAVKADPNRNGSDPPLASAVSQNYPEIVHALLQAGANPNARGHPDASGYRGPLIFDALSHTNILEDLLNAGADSNALGAYGGSPLAYAVLIENEGAVAILLNHGAIPDSRPVCSAAYRLKDGILRLLLDHGANPNVQDGQGKTPLKLVEEIISGNRSIQNIPPDQQKTLAISMADLLRQHGALEVLPDWDRITVSRPSAKYSKAIFFKGTNDWNQFTLFDVLGAQYDLIRFGPYGVRPEHNDLPFPDFSRIIIHRPPVHGTNWTDLKVNLLRALDSGDCGADVPLNFGDVVEVPETDHILNEPWTGLTTNELNTLAKCLTLHLQITVAGTTTNITVGPQVVPLDFNQRIYWNTQERSSTAPITLPALVPKGQALTLWPILETSQLLLSSSGLSQVLVKRRDPATGKTHQWTVDCSDPNRPPDFWLRDGDVIEVPEAKSD